MSQLTIPQYLIESSICLLAFYLLYILLLKRETFFQLNRFYLLGSAISALAIPFINFDLQYTPDAIAMTDYMLPMITKAQTSHMSLVEAVEAPSPLIISIGDIIRLIYGLGVLIMTMKFLDALFKVINMIGQGKKQKIGENTLVSHSGNVPSSSFFSYIFWNDNDNKKSTEVHSTIINHELVHVRQWHSLDVICMEILVILKWFNPLIYLFRKSLRLTHEYIADRYMAAQTDKLSYAHILISQNQGDSKLPLSNTFYSDIKERLSMMGKLNSSYWRLSKGLMIIPLYAALLSLFSFNFIDHIPGVAVNMQQINAAYDKIESKEVVSIDQIMGQGPLASSMDGLTAEQQKNLIIFRWGDMMYNSDPEKVLSDGTLFHQDSISGFSLRTSLEKKPMIYANNAYWYDYQFDVTFHKYDQSYTHTVKVNEDYDGEKWEDISSDIDPDKIVIENLKVAGEGSHLDFYFVFEVDNNSSLKDFGNLGLYRYEVNGKVYVFNRYSYGRFDTEVSSIKKNDLMDLVNTKNWINSLSDTVQHNLNNSVVEIEVVRDILLDSSQLEQSLQIDPLISRDYHSSGMNSISRITEKFIYDKTIKGHQEILLDWIHTLDDGDGFYISVYKEEEYGERMDSIIFSDSFRLDKDKAGPVIYAYKLSEYKNLYEPNIKLTDKFSSAVEESNYQIIYQANDKTLVKLDRMNPENEKILTAFSDESKFDIIHIPNYTTKHRVVEYKENYFSSDKKIIRLSPGLDDIDVHRLPEFEEDENQVQLSWGQMISFNERNRKNNFSIKQFHNSRKQWLRAKVGSEEYSVQRFTIYIIDKSDNITAYQSTSTKAYELNKVLQDIHEESSVYIDDIIIDVDGEWQHVLERFSFVLE